MSSNKLPRYLSSSDHKSNHRTDTNNFTFSQSPNSHNPEKGHEGRPESPRLSSKVEPQTHEEAVTLQPDDIGHHDAIELCDKQPFQTAPKEQIQLDEVSPQVNNPIQSHQEQSNEQNEPRGYQQLTMKLETALNKIAGSTKSPKKSTSQTNTIWRRSQQCAERKKKDLQKKREESQKNKEKEVRSKPIINKQSQRIVKDIGHEPIYNRYQKVLQAKKKKEKEIEEIKKKQKEDEETLFKEELNRYMRRPETVRNYEAYYSEMVKWKEQTAKQNRQKLEIKQSKELQGVTFKPQLNTKSKKLVASQTRLPIDQRGLIKERSKNENSFRPNMSHKTGK